MCNPICMKSNSISMKSNSISMNGNDISHIPSLRRKVVCIEEPASSVSRSRRLRPTLDASDLLPSQSLQQLTQRPPSEEPYPDKESPFPPLRVEESLRCIATRTSPRTVNLSEYLHPVLTMPNRSTVRATFWRRVTRVMFDSNGFF